MVGPSSGQYRADLFREVAEPAGRQRAHGDVFALDRARHRLNPVGQRLRIDCVSSQRTDLFLARLNKLARQFSHVHGLVGAIDVLLLLGVPAEADQVQKATERLKRAAELL